MQWKKMLLCWVICPLVIGLGAPSEASKIIIAHRGASGYLPEHTLPAYAMAYALGADYIEPDLVMTKDGHLICIHDITLEATTNVAQVFPGRQRADGRWYAADFTLAEIKQLAARERTTFRFRQDSLGFQIPTFEEMIQLIQELNRLTGRQVGIYPETKSPAYHQKLGLSMEEPLLAILDRYGYHGPQAKVFIQSFEPDNLKKMRFDLKTDLPLVQLISGGREYDAMVTSAGLAEVATYANGIGPTKRRIEDSHGNVINDNFLVEEAHRLGLLVHPYTFRAEAMFLPTCDTSMVQEVERFLYGYGVDGLFTDHTDLARQALASVPLPGSLTLLGLSALRLWARRRG